MNAVDNIDINSNKNPEVKPPIGEAQWRAHYLEWRRSSMSKAQFCKTHQLVIENFYYWARRFQDEEAPSTPNHFVPVISRNSEPTKIELVAIDLLLPNQTRLKFSIKETRLVSLIQEMCDAVTVIR
jgi:hypothetical protein